MNSELRHSRSKSRKMNYDRRDDHSQSYLQRDMECYYCHKKGHIRGYCEELKKQLEARKNFES